jgi:hypothetical protein
VEWSPSFECHVRPDGEHEYRIGHQLIDEFLEFVVGRSGIGKMGVAVRGSRSYPLSNAFMEDLQMRHGRPK